MGEKREMREKGGAGGGYMHTCHGRGTGNVIVMAVNGKGHVAGVADLRLHTLLPPPSPSLRTSCRKSSWQRSESSWIACFSMPASHGTVTQRLGMPKAPYIKRDLLMCVRDDQRQHTCTTTTDFLVMIKELLLPSSSSSSFSSSSSPPLRHIPRCRYADQFLALPIR